jgi:hypothetical protein
MSEAQYTEAGVTIGDTFLSWEDLDAERNKFRFANSVLVKVGFSYGRVTEIEDAQIYDKAEWKKIKTALEGKSAWFSEFAGKYSEVSLDFWSTVSVEETTDLEAIVEFHRLHGFYQHDLGIVSGAIEQLQENGELDNDLNTIGEEDEE